MSYNSTYTNDYSNKSKQAPSNWSKPVEVITTTPPFTGNIVVHDLPVDLVIDSSSVKTPVELASNKWYILLEVDASTGNTKVIRVSHA